MLKKQIRGWFWVSVSTLTLAILLLISPSVTLAQRDLIPIDGSDEDIQRLFDLIYSFLFIYCPCHNPARLWLQNSPEVEAYQLIRRILHRGTTLDIRSISVSAKI